MLFAVYVFFPGLFVLLLLLFCFIRFSLDFFLFIFIFFILSPHNSTAMVAFYIFADPWKYTLRTPCTEHIQHSPSKAKSYRNSKSFYRWRDMRVARTNETHIRILTQFLLLIFFSSLLSIRSFAVLFFHFTQTILLKHEQHTQHRTDRTLTHSSQEHT